MKNGISRLTAAPMLFLIILTSSFVCCATLSWPALDQRTLRISESRPGSFEYSDYVCTKRILGFCSEHGLQTEYYDLGDAIIRHKLNDMGFVLQVRASPIK